MLYALANPASLVVLLLSFLLSITLQGWVSSLVAARAGDPTPRHEGRTKPDPRRHLDPFGAVSAAISGLGWARPVDLPARRGKGAAVAVALSGPLVSIVLGVAALVGWAVLYGPVGSSGDVLALAATTIGPAQLLQEGGPLTSSSALFLAGCSLLFLGVLALVPLPPLPGGRLMLALAPRTIGWQKAEHQLVERNIGVAVLLALMLLPLGRNIPLLPTLLDIVLTPLVRAICGG